MRKLFSGELDMRRSWNGPACAVAAISVLVNFGLASPARCNDDPLRRQVLEFNKITGAAPLAGQFKMLVDNPKETRKLLETAQALAKEKNQPLRYHAAYLLALVAAQMKDVPTSEYFYRICMQQAAKFESLRKILESYVGLIDLLYENKKFEASERVCRELLELQTGNGKKRQYIVVVTGRFGEPEFEELDAFDIGKRLRPYVHRLLIQAICKEGKYDQALKLAESLIKAKDHWEQRQLKAWVLREAGRMDEAAKTYEDVIDLVGKDKDLEPEEREAGVKRYQYILSNVYVDLNQIDKAAGLLKALLAKEPNDPGFNNDLGYIWADHGMNLQESEKLIRKALELDRQRRKSDPKLDPKDDVENGAYLDSLAWVLFKQGKAKEAKEVMLKAVEDKNSQHIEIYEHLGDILDALGERQAAIDAYRKGIEVAGDTRREQQRKVEVEKKLKKGK
jgi:tetratricopeptide (TPR) repeat protein